MYCDCATRPESLCKMLRNRLDLIAHRFLRSQQQDEPVVPTQEMNVACFQLQGNTPRAIAIAKGHSEVAKLLQQVHHSVVHMIPISSHAEKHVVKLGVNRRSITSLRWIK